MMPTRPIIATTTHGAMLVNLSVFNAASTTDIAEKMAAALATLGPIHLSRAASRAVSGFRRRTA
jgi:hypothetical protein